MKAPAFHRRSFTIMIQDFRAPVSRRRFLRNVSAAALAPAFIPNLRAASPNGKIRHASVGVGGQGNADLNTFAGHPKFELVAVCDADSKNFDWVKQRWPEVRCYQNWRDLLAKEGDKIDSVNVATPDHMHGPVGAAAMELGKHLYGQKPLTQNLRECRHLTELARAKGLMTQMGIQVSSEFNERFAVHFTQSGIIGKIKEVHTFSDKEWGDMSPLPQREDKVPESLDWNLWLGPAAERPYINGIYHPGNWRKRRDFGTGTLGDMGCHIFSSWFRGLAIGAPKSVKSTGPAPNKDSWALNGRVEYVFPGTQYTEGGDVKVTWYDGPGSRPPQAVADLVGGKIPGQGSVIIGTEGAILFGHGSRPFLYPQDKFKSPPFPKLEPRNHYHEFIDKIIAGGPDKPSANFDYAGPLTESVLLGCLASIFPNQALEWDGPSMTFKNSPDATALVGRSYRKGWEIPNLKA